MNTILKLIFAIVLLFDAIRIQRDNVTLNPLGYIALMMFLVFYLN